MTSSFNFQVVMSINLYGSKFVVLSLIADRCVIIPYVKL